MKTLFKDFCGTTTSPTDPYTALASKIFQVSPQQVTPEQRKLAKLSLYRSFYTHPTISMNTTKPNSIQLAEALEAQIQVGGGDLYELELAAAELRKLQSENDGMQKLLIDIWQELNKLKNQS